MNGLVVFAAFLALGFASPIEKKASSVNLTLYYESYCPYCIDFVTTQLYSTWTELSSKINLELVPFGNAEQTYDATTGEWTFVCQHGTKECIGNILHSCAIYEACDGEQTLDCSTTQLTKVMGYIDCLMKASNQKTASNKCAKKNGLNYKTINTCANGKIGNELENMYGNLTAACPGYAYTPFIVINGKHNDKEQNAAQSDLKKYLCKLVQC